VPAVIPSISFAVGGALRHWKGAAPSGIVVPPFEGTSYRGAEGVAAHTSAPPSRYPDWPDGSIIYGGTEPNLRVGQWSGTSPDGCGER
jgi:hypothetical protein